MSDSEDEGAFASADEGDSPTKKSSPAKGNRDDKKDVRKQSNPPKSSGNTGNGKSQPSATSTSDSGKKESEKQQKQQTQARQKKKGKATTQNTQSSPKKAASNPHQASSKQVPADDVAKEPQSNSSETMAHNTDSKNLKEKASEGISGEKKTNTGSDNNLSKPLVSKDEKAAEGTEDPMKDAKADQDSVNQTNLEKAAPTASPEKSGSGSSGGGGWGWGGWGSSLLSAASSSVQTFTHQLGDGISTIMDTVESSLDDLVTDEKEKSKNAPKTDPSPADNVKEPGSQTSEKTTEEQVTDDLPNRDKPIEEEPKPVTATPKSEESNPSGGNFFASWGIADIAKKMTDTGKSLASKGQTLMTDGFDAVENLASGGIDVLESIGKKTYHTFSEHDPAFKKTREYLKSRGTKPNLSSVLREAKEQAEQEAVQAKENEEARKVHFETQLDEYQGIAHLEALEMLSGQSEKKVLSLLNSLSSDDHKMIKPILISIKEIFEVEEEEDPTSDQDFSCLVNKHLSELKLGTSSDKLNKVHDMVKQWMADLEMQDTYNPKAIHEQAIQSLAELTSKGVEQFHKAGELVLMQRDSEKDCKERAHSFARLTGVLCHEVGNLATKFTDCLNKSITAEKEEESDVTTMVTNIYLEASNSTTYIQDAFQLLLPILQQAAIEHMILARQS